MAVSIGDVGYLLSMTNLITLLRLVSCS